MRSFQSASKISQALAISSCILAFSATSACSVKGSSNSESESMSSENASIASEFSKSELHATVFNAANKPKIEFTISAAVSGSANRNLKVVIFSAEADKPLYSHEFAGACAPNSDTQQLICNFREFLKARGNVTVSLTPDAVLAKPNNYRAWYSMSVQGAVYDVGNEGSSLYFTP